MSEKIRILIADDHAVVRRGLRALINTEPDMEVVGEASDGVEAVEQASELNPDLILLDMVMPKKKWPGSNRRHQGRESRRPHPGPHQFRARRPGLPRHQSWGPGVYFEGLLSAGSDTSHPRRSQRRVIPRPLHRAYADCRIEQALLHASHRGPSNRP